MKKHLITLAIFLWAYQSFAQTCVCQSGYNPSAELNINGNHYYSNSLSSPTIIPAITLPLGVTTYTGNFTVIQNANCVKQNQYDPGTCASSKTTIRVQNPNLLPVSGQISKSSTNTVSFPNGTITNLLPGINTITVYSNCCTSPSCTSAQERALGVFKIQVNITPQPNFTATGVKSCHYIISGPQHIQTFTGKTNFKFRFTSAPPNGIIVQLWKLTGSTYTLVQGNPISGNYSANTDYFFDNSGQGYAGAGTYQIRFYLGSTQVFMNGTTTPITIITSNPC